MSKTILTLEQEDRFIQIQKVRLEIRDQYIAITRVWDGENWNAGNSAYCATFASLWQTICFTTDPFTYTPEDFEMLPEPDLKVMQETYKQKTNPENSCEQSRKEWLEFLKLELKTNRSS